MYLIEERCENVNCDICQEFYSHCDVKDFYVAESTFVSREKGLFSSIPIGKGKFVLEYEGKIRKRRNKSKFLIEVSSSPRLYIDATDSGIYKFLNHSCEPNCALVKWKEGTTTHVSIKTTRNILENEELTAKYGDFGKNCMCPKCQGGLKRNSTNNSLRNTRKQNNKSSMTCKLRVTVKGIDGYSVTTISEIFISQLESLSNDPSIVTGIEMCVFTMSCDQYYDLTKLKRDTTKKLHNKYFRVEKNQNIVHDEKRLQTPICLKGEHNMFHICLKELVNEILFMNRFFNQEIELIDLVILETRENCWPQQLHRDYQDFQNEYNVFFFIVPLEVSTSIWVEDIDGSINNFIIQQGQLFLGGGALVHAGSSVVGKRIHGKVVPKHMGKKGKRYHEIVFEDDDTYMDRVY